MINLKVLGNARLRHFKKDAFPHHNSIQLECAKCGNRQYDVYVEPKEDDARVVGLVCAECRDVWRLDLAAFLDGKGKLKRVQNGDL